MTTKRKQCECSDVRCPVHYGKNKCDAVESATTLFRIDMEDRSGTRFCSDCADDAMESGLFNDGADDDESDNDDSLECA